MTYQTTAHRVGSAFKPPVAGAILRSTHNERRYVWVGRWEPREQVAETWVVCVWELPAAQPAPAAPAIGTRAPVGGEGRGGDLSELLASERRAHAATLAEVAKLEKRVELREKAVDGWAAKFSALQATAICARCKLEIASHADACDCAALPPADPGSAPPEREGDGNG